MKLKQRALALMLSMMMVLTFMPALAFADTTASGVAHFNMYMDPVLLVNSDNMLYPGSPSVEVEYDDGHYEYPAIEVKDMAFADSSFGTITKYDGESEDYSGWIATPVKTGKTDIEVTFVYENDPSKEFEYKYTKSVTVVKKIEKIYIKTDDGDRRALPGDTVALHALMSYEDEDYEVPENLTYEWSIDDYAVQTGCTVTGSGADAELVISNNYDGSNIDVSVIAYDGKEPYAADTDYVDVDDDIYKVFCDGLREDFLPGETITFTPVVKYRSTTDREWREVSDYRGVSDIVINVYTDNYNEETGEWEEKASESGTLKIEKNADGSYTLTRKAPGYAYLNVDACYTDAEGEQNAFDSYGIQFDYYDYDVDLGYDEVNLYNGGTVTLTADVNRSGDYDFEFKVYKATGTNQDEYGSDVYSYEELNNSGNKYFTTDGDKITLNGTTLWEDLKDGYIAPYDDYPVIKVEVNLLVNGVIISSDNRELSVYNSGKDYDLSGMDLMIGYLTEYYTDDIYAGYINDADHPNGDEFTYKVIKVVSSNPSAIKAYKYKDAPAWAIKAVGVGTATVTFTVKDEFGVTAEVPVTYRGVTDIYEIDHVSDSSDALPGDSVILEAEGTHQNYKVEDELNDFSFKWVIENNEEYVDSIDTLTENGSKVRFNVKKDIPAAELDREPAVSGRVYIVDKDGNVQEDASEDFEFFITNTTYVYKPAAEDIPSKPDINETIEFEPRVFKRSIVNGEVKEEEVTDFVWMISYDPDEVKITDSEGNEITSEYDFDDTEDYVFNEGGFTVKRRTAEGCSFRVNFYKYDEDEEDYYHFGSNRYYFDSWELLYDAEISNIKTKTYTGKAIKQSPVLEDWHGKLVEGKDYKVTYKNNKNVGTATIIFTGIGDYRGTTSVTFKINPKGTALSKVTAGSKSFTAIWKKQATQTTGYQIQYGLKSNFKGAKTATVKKNKTVKTTIKKLKSKKTYYVRIRTYKTVSGKNYYSSWSKAKKVKVK